MSTKTLYLHVGSPKTGSTAIQKYLAENSKRLLDVGYNYEFTSDGGYKIDSGNGEILFGLMNEGRGAGIVESYIDSLFEKASRVILSCELFSVLTAESLDRLKTVILNVGVEVKIICFIRDVQPLAISDYDQRIKRHGECRSFGEYLLDYSWQHYDVAISFYKVFGGSVVARSYDAISGNLIPEFLEIIGISHAQQCQGWRPVHEFDGVNRGLTSEERRWLIEMNRIFGKRYSSSLSDVILLSKKEKIEIFTGRKELIDAFGSGEAWQTKVEEVNKMFGLSSNPIRLARPLSVDYNRQEDECTYQYQNLDGLSLERTILLWAIDRLKESFNESVDFVVEKMSASIDNAIPKNFDPVVYLLKNKDILLSDHDPTLHYLKFGRQEGREFELPPRD